jgi:uncharacterized protein (TIGR02145 family)
MKQTKHVFLLAVIAMFVGACDPDEKSDERSDEQNEQKDDEQNEQPNGAVRMRIGKHDYLTYVYGGKRWMVENSKEGTPSGIAYGSDENGNQCAGGGGIYDNLENGYYYTSEQAATACPDGWGLPTTPDAENLNTSIQVDKNGARWWTGKEGITHKAFAGTLEYTGRLSPPSWAGWGTTGWWWIETRTGARLRSRYDLDYVSAFIPMFGGSLSSVRCVQK